MPTDRNTVLTRKLIATCLVLGMAVLGGCSDTTSCAANYRGGCLEGAPMTPPESAAPTRMAPTAAPSAAVAPVAGAAGLGDPASFAAVDDKQCRSYGLTFGSHDYADCRIRLSAQHRGLDPNR